MKKSIYTSGLFLTLLVGLIASCVVEDSGTGKGPEGEEAYLAMELATPPETTGGRAMGVRGIDDDINVWENRINEVWMLLYDSDKNTLDYKYVWKIRNYSEAPELKLVNFYNSESEEVVMPGTAKATSFISAAQKIKRKDYKMAVLANPNQDIFKDLTIGSNLGLLQKAIDGGNQGLSVNDFGSYLKDPSTTRLFFMSNANGLINVPKGTLKASEKDAAGSPVSIYLDRLLARVSVIEKDGGVDIKTSDVVMDPKRPFKWYLDVVNKKTYPIRQYAAFLGGNTMENESNSLTTNREEIYAKDPNFIQADNTESNFLKWGNGDNPPFATWKSVDKQDPSLRTYQYTFENTMDLATQSSSNGRNFTTCIVSNVYLIYKKLLSNSSDLSNDNDPGRSYYSCLLERADKTTEWKVFTHDQAKYWLEVKFDTSEDPKEAEMYKLLEEKIKSIQKDYTDGNTEAFNFTTDVSPGKEPSKYRSYKGVTYHPLGLNKYCSPIRHFPAGSSANPEKEVYGYYGVVRNNHYKLTINSISGPGTGIYDWDNRFISAEISITPWYRRDFQGENLK